MDALGDAVVIFDAASCEIREVNRKMGELLGCSPAAACRLNLKDLVEDVLFPPAVAASGDGLREWRIKDRSGRSHRLEARLTQTVLEGWEQTCAVLRELDGRQPAETKYYAIFDIVNDGIAVVDLETGNFLEVNQRWCEMTGYSREEARNLNVAALCLDQPPYRAADAMRWITEATREKPQLFEFMAQTKEGRRHWVELNLRRAAIDGQERLLAVIRDITARKRTEEELRISEENYRTIFNSANDGIAVVEIETGRFLDFNQRWLELAGFTKEEAEEITLEAFCSAEPPFTKRDAQNWFSKTIETGPQVFEWFFKDKQGRDSWVEVNLKRAAISGRECILANVRDISERKRAEEALCISEENYRTIFDSSHDGVLVMEIDTGKILDANPKALEMNGYTLEELKNRNLELFCFDEPPYTKREAWKWFWRAAVEAPKPLNGRAESRRIVYSG